MTKPNERKLKIRNSTAEFLIYKTDDGQVKLEVRLENENIWLTQQMMAELFQTSIPNISIHIRNIYEEGELSPEATVKDFLTLRKEGKRQVQRKLDYYNLDIIISVGYRIKSIIATRFRIWATERLHEYIVKGFTMDDERLKNPPLPDSPVPDYFQEMLVRIRDIRSSERRMYLRVREIFAMAADYEPSLPESNRFFSVIQNKLHFVATGMTAAEIVRARANAHLPNMGLTSWQREEIRKTDVIVAKNYLLEHEIEELNRIVTMWLDFAEDQARRRKLVFLLDWEEKLDDFLEFNDRSVLKHAGSISKKEAESHAYTEYEQYADERRKHKEQLGTVDSIRMLEETAKRIEDGVSNRDKKE